MSDQSIELEPSFARTSAVSKHLLDDVHRHDHGIPTRKGIGGSVSSSSLPDDEAVLAHFGKKQQLKVRSVPSGAC